MQCPSCRARMAADPPCQSFDEYLTLTVTDWRCRGCGEVVEEIAADSMDQGSGRFRLHYVVREWQPPARKRRNPAQGATGLLRDAAA